MKSKYDLNWRERLLLAHVGEYIYAGSKRFHDRFAWFIYTKVM